MARIEDLTRGASVKGILPDGLVTVVDVTWFGSAVVGVTWACPANHASQSTIAAMTTIAR